MRSRRDLGRGDDVTEKVLTDERILPYLRDAHFTRLLGLSRNVDSPQGPFFRFATRVEKGKYGHF